MSSARSLGQLARRKVRPLRRRLRRLRAARRTGAGQERPAPRTAILVVNGFDRTGRWGAYNAEEAQRFPWINLCLQQIERHSRDSSYEVLVWDNSPIAEQRHLLRQHPKVRRFAPRDPDKQVAHGPALDRLVKKVRPGTEFIITLDTDAFPIRDGWIENLTGRLSDDVWLAGVWRDEMVPKKPAFIHPCGTAVRVDTLRKLDVRFARLGGADVGYHVTEAVEAAGGICSKLHRSNRWNPHFLMGAIYGDLIYHQGAGSRNPRFKTGGRAEVHEGIRQALRDAAFEDLDALLDALAGNRDPDEAAPVVARVSAQ